MNTLWLIIIIATGTPQPEKQRIEFQNSNDCAKAAALVEKYNKRARATCVREYETVRG